MKKIAGFLIIFFIVFSLSGVSFSQSLEERLESGDRLAYEVYFNAVPVGKIEWKYFGRKLIEGRLVDILYLNSDTEIMKLLNLTSEERVFLDVQTRLPYKVERDVVFFGKKELIEEIYDQDKGCVKIKKTSSEVKEEILCVGKPVRNILELLYFFPESIDLKKEKWMEFNLPTQNLKIKFVQEKILKMGKDKKDTYFLKGEGAKKFNLWLDKKKKLPLRLEFITLVGKVTILRQDISQ